MKIFSYLERRIAEYRQFRKDVWHVRVSLALRPKNWHGSINKWGTGNIPNNVFEIHNDIEGMYVWTANERWGMHFKIEGRQYGGVVLFGDLIWWRRAIYDAAVRAILEDRAVIIDPWK